MLIIDTAFLHWLRQPNLELLLFQHLPKQLAEVYAAAGYRITLRVGLDRSSDSIDHYLWVIDTAHAYLDGIGAVVDYDDLFRVDLALHLGSLVHHHFLVEGHSPISNLNKLYNARGSSGNHQPAPWHWQNAEGLLHSLQQPPCQPFSLGWFVHLHRYSFLPHRMQWPLTQKFPTWKRQGQSLTRLTHLKQVPRFCGTLGPGAVLHTQSPELLLHARQFPPVQASSLGSPLQIHNPQLFPQRKQLPPLQLFSVGAHLQMHRPELLAQTIQFPLFQALSVFFPLQMQSPELLAHLRQLPLTQLD